MTSLLVGIPTLGRPGRAAAVAESARASVTGHDLRILFLCNTGDNETIAACRATGEDVEVVPWRPGKADWARKLNLAYDRMGEEWLLLGADDLRFHDGWFDKCLAAAARSDACVVGTNDLGNARVVAGHHSTHPLVHRDYIGCGGVIDDPSRLLPEVYGHWFVDDEFVRTAQARGTYAHAFEAIVEHLHPNWGKSEDDATYRRGQATIARDQALFESRRGLWESRRGVLRS
jgi:hypothetical protein